jgi:gamma-glutamyl phosphate reductase
MVRLKFAAHVVDGLDDAIAHIRRDGSDHTEVIATADETAARRFVPAFRSAVVVVNASFPSARAANSASAPKSASPPRGYAPAAR